MNIQKILAGEFAGEMATKKEKTERAKYVVCRIGTSRAQANINRMIDSCQNTAGTWQWSDNSTTVVDIRLK